MRISDWSSDVCSSDLKFVNDLTGGRGSASISFSDLNEDLWSGGADLSYELAPRITATVGYAYSDTHRTSVRRDFLFRAQNLPIAVQQLRPDSLLSDAAIQLFHLRLLQTSAPAHRTSVGSGKSVAGRVDLGGGRLIK